MNIELLREFCLAKRGVTESLPFDEETLVFKVCGKIFAVLALEKPDRVVMKCHPARVHELRDRYVAIGEAPYFHKASWNQIRFDLDADDALILHLLDHAYGETLRGLPKKRQIEFFSQSLPPWVRYVHKNVCASTMEEIAQLLPPDTHPMSLVTTDLQRAGRGQRGNHWESANGQNILFSFSFRPEGVKPAEQFYLSEAAALALVDTIRPLLPADGPALTIKWPNDIYLNDSKLGGMLLEHTIVGRHISCTTLGIGLNVNQKVFHSDAPNPISLSQAMGYEFPRYLLLETYLAHFFDRLDAFVCCGAPTGVLHAEFLHNLYRWQGVHTFRDAAGSFRASIADVLPTGHLVLRCAEGTKRSYAFKEVQFVL